MYFKKKLHGFVVLFLKRDQLEEFFVQLGAAIRTTITVAIASNSNITMYTSILKSSLSERK